MGLKSLIVPRVAEKMLSRKTLEKIRAKFERERLKTGAANIVEFFHDPSDPYSQLLEKALTDFPAYYNVDLKIHLVGPPGADAAPEAEKLRVYAKKDAAQLARKAGIDYTFIKTPPAKNTAQADARLKALGHYLGGMLYHGGEWYWGLDRLHYLEERLADLGPGSRQITYAPPVVPSGRGDTGAELHWYLSFRSPYSSIVRDRVKALADAYGATLKLRFVLPMVMRGLPVSPLKKKYIPLDTAREAHRLGVAFGRICDPVGKPVELAYSLLPWARQQGRDYEYARSWLSGVWAQGIDAGRERGLRKIVERAGLGWTEAKTVLGSENWREEAEANRVEMLDYGIWGAPSFRVGDIITWGQDRLWVIEDALKLMPSRR